MAGEYIGTIHAIVARLPADDVHLILWNGKGQRENNLLSNRGISLSWPDLEDSGGGLSTVIESCRQPHHESGTHKEERAYVL